jgi:tetratricopeptide (TPR) repeat protein
MKFFKKLLASKDPLEAIRQCHARQDWAGVLHFAKVFETQGSPDDLPEEIKGFITTAGDTLAQANISEAQWCQQSGDFLRAKEDLELALAQARSEGIREQALQALECLDQGMTGDRSGLPGHNVQSHASCQSCDPVKVSEPQMETGLDEDTRVELLLATMPQEYAQRYKNLGSDFRKAWLAAQDGEDEKALDLFEQILNSEHDCLFLFERGSLLARAGQHKKAYSDLQGALAIEPGFFPAYETLVDVLMTMGRMDELENSLKNKIADQHFSGFCWAKLSEIKAQRGELEPALTAGLKALDEGYLDQGLIVLCAQLLEHFERYSEAEALLQRLSTAGCGGGVHPMLAEYWLRRGQNLDQALEAFKKVLRQEPDNPRWLLRIAQVYLKKGWHKEATKQIEQLMQRGGLNDQMRAEVNAIANQLLNR